MQPQDNHYVPNNQTQPAQQPAVQTPQVFGPQMSVDPATTSASGYAAPDLSAPVTPNVTGTAPERHKRKFMRPVVAALAVLVVLGGLAGAGYGLNAKYSKDHATTTAKNFIGLLNAGNDTAAYNSLTRNLRSIQTENQFKTNLGDLTAKNPVFSKQSVQVSGANAVYTATVNGLPKTDFGRTDGAFTVALVKHGLNSWQVDGVLVQ